MNKAMPSGKNSETVLADKEERGNALSCEPESVPPAQVAMESAPITQLLAQWQEGDQQAFAELAKLMDKTLHSMARRQMRSEHSGHTLQATALIHEAYLRLSGKNNISYKSRAHFYNIAATKMRQILADYARARLSAKRGGGAVKLSLDDQELVALDDALTRLAKTLPEHAKVVDLRYFGGFTIEETADALKLSPGTVKRYWQFARAWLKKELGENIEE
jgi:RNA polymerase sigma factor (TIGR02999 family)